MKRIAAICLVVVLMLIPVMAVNCDSNGDNVNGDSKAIEDTIKGYISSYNASDFDECITYFTGYGDEEDAKSMLALFRGLSGEMGFQDVSDVSITEQTATVTVVFTIGGEEGTDEMQLRKVDGKWKILWEQDGVNGGNGGEKVEVLVQDEENGENNPIAGAEVTIYNAEKEIVRTAITNDEGIAIFENVPAADGIVATKEGYTTASWAGGGHFAGEPYKLYLRSFEFLAQLNEHAVWVVVAPPFLSIAQGGSGTATATLFSFERPCRVSLALQHPFEPPPQITLQSSPEQVTLPDTGQASLNLTLTVDSDVAPGIYSMWIVPEVVEDLEEFLVGHGRSTGGGPLRIEVKSAGQ